MFKNFETENQPLIQVWLWLQISIEYTFDWFQKLTKIYLFKYQPLPLLTAKSFLGIADACECAYGFSERCSEDTFFTISTFTASEISLDFLSETYLAVTTDPLFLLAPCSNCFTSSLDFADRWEVKCVAGCTRSLDSPVQRNHYNKLWSSEMDISFFSLKVSSTHRTLFLPYFHSKRIKKKLATWGWFAFSSV